MPNPACRHSNVLTVATRDALGAVLPLTAMVAQARLLVVTRRSGV
ncbi:hypothetical protein ACFVMC_20345 [Nocardia sp. NPDC127579]